MAKAKIKTSGMHCSSCEMLLGDALQEINGVSKAKANHKTGIVEVDFDDLEVDEREIRQAIESEGYNVI